VTETFDVAGASDIPAINADGIPRDVRHVITVEAMAPDVIRLSGSTPEMGLR